MFIVGSMAKDIKEIEQEYELELDKAVEEIKNKKAKKVLLQFPDGMKPYSMAIADYLEEKTGAEVRIWLGTCYGACDVPNSDSDLIIQFGHARWV